MAKSLQMPVDDKLVGTIEFAGLLRCHPTSIPKFVKSKPGFPKPRKLFGKNVWPERVALEYRERLLRGDGKAA